MDSERGTRDTSRDPAEKTSMTPTVHFTRTNACTRIRTVPPVHVCVKFTQCTKSVLPLDRSSLPARSYPSYDENSVGLADDLILRRCLAHSSVGHARVLQNLREKKMDKQQLGAGASFTRAKSRSGRCRTLSDAMEETDGAAPSVDGQTSRLARYRLFPLARMCHSLIVTFRFHRCFAGKNDLCRLRSDCIMSAECIVLLQL